MTSDRKGWLIAYRSFNIRFWKLLASLLIKLNVAVIQMAIVDSPSCQALWASIPGMVFVSTSFTEAVLLVIELLVETLLWGLVFPVCDRFGIGMNNRCRWDVVRDVVSSAGSCNGMSIEHRFLISVLPSLLINLHEECF